MKLSKKEILSNYEKYKYRSLSIGCLELMTEDLFYTPFEDDDMFIVERKLEDLNLSQNELKCFEDFKVIMKKLSKKDKKLLINMLLKDRYREMEEIRNYKPNPSYLAPKKKKILEKIIIGKRKPTHRIKKIEKKINEIIDCINSKGELV